VRRSSENIWIGRLLLAVPLIAVIIGILKISGLLVWDSIGDFIVMGIIIGLSAILFVNRSELFVIRLVLSLFAIGWLGFEETTFGSTKVEEVSSNYLIPSEGSLAPPLIIQPIQNPAVKAEVYDFSQNNWTMVNFWASWCNPCIQEMPVIDSFYQRNKLNGLEIIGVTQITPNAGGANKKNQTLEREWSILQLLDISYPIFLDPSGDGVSAYGAEVLPLSFIIDGSGNILKVGEGTSGTMTLLKWLDEQIE
jgi:thiol-disulfide isomerase/thioredoxin